VAEGVGLKAASTVTGLVISGHLLLNSGTSTELVV
jgi:hypothetical protein